MLEKILTMLVKKLEPNREVTVEKIGKRFFMVMHDSVGCNDYLLKGQYSYNEVIALNELTGYNCGFGFCNEIGPVAFIGVNDPNRCTNSGYFNCNVHEYGNTTSDDEKECHFSAYSEREAMLIDNYTVYGDFGLEEVAKKTQIAKVSYFYDSRYKAKKINEDSKEKKVLKMDLKLKGTYNFYDARLLATGTREDKEGYTGDEHPIQFAVLDNNKYVGIINLWYHKNDCYFRDVWEYGCDEPKLQKIRFLSKEEAEKVDNFTLYVYVYPHSLKTKEYPIEKQDRTFDRRFEFQLPDGTDYRVV